MPVIKYKFFDTKPGTSPRLYTSCRTNSNYTSTRWWDGQLWWDITATRGTKALVFKWPKGLQANGIRQSPYMKHYKELYLRKISDQSVIRWAVPYKHYEPTEVLAWLVKQGRLPADWKTAFQDEIRDSEGSV